MDTERTAREGATPQDSARNRRTVRRTASHRAPTPPADGNDTDGGASIDTATRTEHAADEAARKPRLFADVLPPRAEPAATTRVPRWRALFAAASAREILARIVPDDPLGVRAVVARRLHEQALLADADAVHLRSLALVARWAPRYQGDPDFADWLERIVDRALIEIVEDDEGDAPGSDEPASCLTASARALAVDPSRLRGAFHAFNRLPVDDRRAFFDLVLRARPLQDVAREHRRGAVDVARHARRGLDTLLAVLHATGTACARGAASRDHTALPENLP